MHDFMLMEPTNQTFQELIGNGVQYTVPRFQRDYTWSQEQWEDLWEDIETLDAEHYHYMGYIVLQRKGKHDFEIIDGQQRLITLSLLVLASIKQISSLIDKGQNVEENKKRREVLFDRFIGSINPISLRISSKLSLNRNNGRHYKDICENLIAPNLRGLTLTNRLLNKAFDFFCSKNKGNTGEEIATFIEKLTSGMMFTKIVVQDSFNAYKVFETLNSRGVQLSTPDLLKNYIFSVINKQDLSDEKLDDLDGEWATVVSQLGENNFTDFIRYHHNFQAKLVTKKDLFTSVRRLANTPESAYNYLNSLRKYASVYASLLNPYDEWWSHQKDDYRETREYLEAFNLFRIKQPFTILMVAFFSFSSEEFVKLVRYLYVLSIRYNVICHHSPNEQDKRYNHIAMEIFKGEFKRASHVKNSKEFRELYPSDDAFSNVFEFYKMPSRQSSKKIRFLLSKIESHLGNKISYNKTTLEHICPYNITQDWHEYFGQGVNDIQDRLGNFVLLEKDDLQRKDFEEKKTFYSKTSFLLAKKVAQYEMWNLKNLNEYQTFLAETAIKTWTI